MSVLTCLPAGADLFEQAASEAAAGAAAVSAPAPLSSPDASLSCNAPSVPSLETLHPALWRAHQLGRQAVAVLGSGFAALDAELPGGGWPAGMLTELLLPHPGVGELRLLAPVLAALQQQQRSVMWLAPPACPCAWALAALGLDVRQLVLVQAQAQAFGPDQAVAPVQASMPMSMQALKHPLRSPPRLPAADLLWALEQALRSGHLGAVLAWLPARLPADALRRLQLAAQAHEGPVFLLRDAAEQQRPSAAPLRLALHSAGPDRLQLRLFKRRGPPLARPLTLELPAVLSAPALQRARRLPQPVVLALQEAPAAKARVRAAAAQPSPH